MVALAGGLGAGRLLAEAGDRSAIGAGSCRLTPQD
jgi:hypothetical protein